jgi:hypothetical protein
MRGYRTLKVAETPLFMGRLKKNTKILDNGIYSDFMGFNG